MHVRINKARARQDAIGGSIFRIINDELYTDKSQASF